MVCCRSCGEYLETFVNPEELMDEELLCVKCVKEKEKVKHGNKN